MFQAISGSLAVLMLFCSTVAISCAAEPTELEQRITKLEDKVKGLSESVDAINQQITAINNNAIQIAELSERLGAAVEELRNQGASQQEILDSISSRDDTGEVYLPLSSIMDKSATARQEVQRAVEQSIRTEGTLTIENEMDTAQDVLVNRVQHRIQPGATMNLKVPVGTVSTQLPGQEIVNWTIGVPDYRQSVDIKPRHTTARVTSEWTSFSAPASSTVYYGTPIYYSDPWWGSYVIYR